MGQVGDQINVLTGHGICPATITARNNDGTVEIHIDGGGLVTESGLGNDFTAEAILAYRIISKLKDSPCTTKMGAALPEASLGSPSTNQPLPPTLDTSPMTMATTKELS